jgi:hypothetical protein
MARSLCNCESLHDELEFLKATFRQNGYSDRQIRRDLNPPEIVAPALIKPISVAVLLPFVSTIFSRISRLLSRHNIKSVCAPPLEEDYHFRSACEG